MQKYWFCLNIYFWLWIEYIIIKFFQNWTTFFLNHPTFHITIYMIFSQICFQIYLIKYFKYVGLNVQTFILEKFKVIIKRSTFVCNPVFKFV